jgi:hypothetical protein
MAYKLTVFSLMAFLVSSPALACEPCYKIYSLQDTIQKSDLIIVGERADYKEGEVSDKVPSGPVTINIRVQKILKGKAVNPIIKVHSWYGMCSYGIYLNNTEQAVLYLSKKDDAYDAVDNGCAQKSNAVVDGQVQIENKKISIEEFQRTYLNSK